MAYQKVYMNQIYSSSLLCQLAQMWHGDVLCDAVIRTGSTITKAHRVVLVAACPMLQTMDGATVGTQLEVKLSSDIKPESVTSFLKYLYEGFTMLTEDNVRDLEKIAHLLQVDSITKCCLDFRKVLQSATGQSLGNDPRCHFHADQAEFRHVKASELLRSMQNGAEKRSFEGGSVSRKKARVDLEDSSMYNSYSQKTINKPRSGAAGSRQVEDSFELIQTETDATPGSSKVLSHHSASLNVSSQLDESPEVQVVSIPETSDLGPASPGTGSTHRLQSPITAASAAKTLNFGLGGHLSTPQVQRHSSSHAISPLVSGMKSKSAPGSSKSEIHSSLFTPAENIKSGLALSSSQMKSSHTASESKPNGQSDQIVIQPMSVSPVSEVDRPEKTVSPSQSSRPGYVVMPASAQEDSENSAASSTPDLSIVKIEKSGISSQDPSTSNRSIPQLGGDDYGLADDGEEGSDMEIYGDGSKWASGGDEGNQWYIQTLKDMQVETITDPGGGMRLTPAPRQSQGRGSLNPDSTDYLPCVVKSWYPKVQSIKARIVRALSYSKSPIIFLRALQRKVCSVKVDALREACFELMAAGFGKFELKHYSQYFHRDAFYKPSPQSLACGGNKFLIDASVTLKEYTDYFNDLSGLGNEEVIVQKDEELPQGYQLLVTGSVVAVPELWYHTTMNRCQGKSASYILTSITNGLIRPWEVRRGGTSAYDGTPLQPVIDALKRFGVIDLHMASLRVTNILCNTLYNAWRRQIKTSDYGHDGYWCKDETDEKLNPPND